MMRTDILASFLNLCASTVLNTTVNSFNPNNHHIREVCYYYFIINKETRHRVFIYLPSVDMVPNKSFISQNITIDFALAIILLSLFAIRVIALTLNSFF